MHRTAGLATVMEIGTPHNTCARCHLTLLRIRWTVLEWQYRGKYEQLRRSRKACFTLTIFKHAFASAPLREPYARISHVICEGHSFIIHQLPFGWQTAQSC